MSPYGCRHFLIAALLVARAAFAIKHAADGPCFQGPLGNGASSETGLPREWPKDGPPLVSRAKNGWAKGGVRDTPCGSGHFLLFRVA